MDLFMWKKDDIFSKFIKFMALVEKDTNKKVKALKRNSRCEYVLNEF